MPMTKNDIQMLLYQLVNELAPTYGIRDREQFTNALASIISYEDPSWNPAAAGDSGHSVGLFQLHDAGQGTGMSVAERSDPETNIRKAISYLGPIWASSETQGLDFDQSLQRMISEGQRPADPQLAFQRAKAASADVTAGAALQPGVGALGGGSMANKDIFQAMIDYVGITDEKAKGMGYVDANDWAQETFAKSPSTWTNLFKGEGTTTGLAPEEAALTEAQTGRTRAETAQIEQEVGDYARLVSMDEREQKRREIETEISAGTLEWNKGVDKFNAWLNATQEARLRAEKEFDVAEKRAAWTTPGEYYPGTEPGGVNAQMYERAGLPTYPSQKGVPISQMPSLEDTYSKWSQNLGVSQNAPAMAGVSTGPTQSQQFIQDLIAKGKGRTAQGGLPGMAGGGWMPRDRPFIAGEQGPEIIQPTATGTTVTPVGSRTYRPNYQRLLANHFQRQNPAQQAYQNWQRRN
jgi:hypothetical protein